jgi:hypothetical protein
LRWQVPGDTNMNLPIRFPTDAEVIAEESTRFRALTPEDRLRTSKRC